jgi:hypothetical protein
VLVTPLVEGGNAASLLSTAVYTAPHTPPPQSRAEEAYGELKRRLLLGELRLGARLGEERLASSLGLSRTPIREALRAWRSGAGFVTYSRHKSCAPTVSSLGLLGRSRRDDAGAPRYRGQRPRRQD